MEGVLRFLYIVIVLLLAGCSTIADVQEINSNLASGDNHPRGGLYYDTCNKASKELPSISKNVAYISPNGPRCDVRQHVFAINKHGILRSVYGDKDVSQASISYVQQGLEEYLRKTENPKILIHIHGGLVAHKNAVSNAEVIAPWAIQDGYYPIFLVWDSSLNSAYLDYLVFTTDGERNGSLKIENDDSGYNDDGAFKRTLLGATRLIGDIGTGVFKAPENYLVQFDNYWERINKNDENPYRLNAADFSHITVTENSSSIREQVSQDKELNQSLSFPEFLHLNTNEINDGVSWVSPNEMRYHVLIPSRMFMTGFSEVGRNSWDNMVRRTRLAMSSPENLHDRIKYIKSPTKRVNTKRMIVSGQSNQTNCGKTKGVTYQVGGFSQAMDLVNCVLNKHTNAVPAKITLAGHSMGAIVANEILWDYRENNYDKIIYMAAAGSMREFNRMVLPIIREKQNGSLKPHFYNLMLHPLAEARERKFGGIPPQGSLLEWIDEMFEGPRNLEEKTLGKYRNVKRLINSYDKIDKKFMTHRVFPIQEKLLDPFCLKNTETIKNKRCHPLKHGELDDYTFWRDPYLGITKNQP